MKYVVLVILTFSLGVLYENCGPSGSGGSFNLSSDAPPAPASNSDCSGGDCFGGSPPVNKGSLLLTKTTCQVSIKSTDSAATQVGDPAPVDTTVTAGEDGSTELATCNQSLLSLETQFCQKNPPATVSYDLTRNFVRTFNDQSTTTDPTPLPVASHNSCKPVDLTPAGTPSDTCLLKIGGCKPTGSKKNQLDLTMPASYVTQVSFDVAQLKALHPTGGKVQILVNGTPVGAITRKQLRQALKSPANPTHTVSFTIPTRSSALSEGGTISLKAKGLKVRVRNVKVQGSGVNH